MAPKEVDPDKTPVDGRDPMTQLYEEIQELKFHCMRVNDTALTLSSEIPRLKNDILKLKLFQAWFPTAAISIAIIVRLIFMR